MIQISSELPKCLLNEEDNINDYDFVLYHTYLKDPEYRRHYLQKRIDKPTRLMILDNSAYEFFVSGERFNEDDYINVINELKPDYYIVPDELMNKDKTLQNFEHWIKSSIKKINKTSKPYFTPQGRSKSEFLDCFWEMTDKINSKKLSKNLCFPFHNDFFREMCIPQIIQDNFKSPLNIDDHYAVGRVTLLFQLYYQGSLDGYRIHLLGSHNPRELNMLKRIPQIKTFDSGYPVKLGVEDIRIGTETEKPKTIIDNFYNKYLDDQTKDLIKYNVSQVRGYCK